jgi:hypothetical protein
MLLYAVAHQMRLSDGSYAVRSAQYPGCEGRSPQPWLARREFQRALCERVSNMIQEGKIPTLYHSLEEVKSIFAGHCRMQIVAEDRLPTTFDYGVIELVSLSADAAEHLAAMRANLRACLDVTETSIGNLPATQPPGTRIDPKHRGGGARGQGGMTGSPATIPRALALRPQLIALRNIADWQIFVEAEVVEASGARVVQGGDPPNRLKEVQPFVYGPLCNLTTPIRILRTSANSIEKRLATDESPVLFFRVVQHQLARSVASPSRGLHLAVVPDHWKYKQEISGPPPIEPESVGSLVTSRITLTPNAARFSRSTGLTNCRSNYAWASHAFTLKASICQMRKSEWGRFSYAILPHCGEMQ